jgi:hypothetical protein
MAAQLLDARDWILLSDIESDELLRPGPGPQAKIKAAVRCCG